MGVASDHAGVNTNVLADESLVDPLSGNAVLNGIPVEVRAAVPRSRARPRSADSIEPPQLRQVTFAVSDIRAIVECAPQLGHSERSSKRRRQ